MTCHRNVSECVLYTLVPTRPRLQEYKYSAVSTPRRLDAQYCTRMRTLRTKASLSALLNTVNRIAKDRRRQSSQFRRQNAARKLQNILRGCAIAGRRIACVVQIFEERTVASFSRGLNVASLNHH